MSRTKFVDLFIKVLPPVFIVIVAIMAGWMIKDGIEGIRQHSVGDIPVVDPIAEGYNELAKISTNPYPVPISNEESAKIVLDYRAKKSNEWQEFIAQEDNEPYLANAFFYLGVNDYANAGDFGDIESARAAITAFIRSLDDPGNPVEGYSEIDWRKRQFLESSYRLIEDITREQEERAEEDSATVPNSPGDDENPSPATEGELGDIMEGDSLPVLDPGIRP